MNNKYIDTVENQIYRDVQSLNNDFPDDEISKIVERNTSRNRPSDSLCLRLVDHVKSLDTNILPSNIEMGDKIAYSEGSVKRALGRLKKLKIINVTLICGIRYFKINPRSEWLSD